MIILGVDPGTRFAGYGVLKKDGRQAFLLDYGLLKMSPTKSLPTRVGLFYDFFAEKVLKYGVTDIALETPFMGKNAQNFLKLGYMRGILYLLADKNSCTLHEFAPTQVKQALTGYGGASKAQVARVVLQLFPKMKTPQKDDVTDALAVTLCGLWRNKTLSI